ncbi:hypothetical protein imdm_1437 [gamma proteobacterium IMCC2047]|nr:hypothetical protein imdm_1437 [gamma proteobacterium IMCC2047]
MFKGAGTLFAGLLVSAAMVCETIAAGFNYRYRDDNGTMHIGYSVPPEFVDNGYEVLNDNGMVVDVVLPKSVLDQRAAKLLEEAEERHQLELQASKDEALLRFYSVPEDVERVRERKLQELQNFIDIQRANITANRKRLTALQGQAASMERNGQQVSEKILQALETLEDKISDAKQAIELKEEEKERTWLAFELDIERLNELLGEDGKISRTASP